MHTNLICNILKIFNLLIVFFSSPLHLGYCNPSKESIQTCFTPDSNFVLGGSQDGTVHIWNMQTSEKEEILRKPAVGSTRNIIFNPVFMCFATGGEMFHLWIEE